MNLNISAKTYQKLNRLKFSENIENVYWEYDNIPFSLRTSPEQKYLEWSAALADSEKQYILKDELITNCHKIYENTDIPLKLLFSGGIDSEIAFLSMVESKVPFSVNIMKMNNDYNYHDIQNAINWCEAYSIKYEFIDIDIEKFFSTKLDDYTQPLHTVSPQFAVLFWLVEQVDGYPIISEGDPSLYRSGKYGHNKEVFVEGYEEKCAFQRWLYHLDKPGCPKFYRYSSELEYAYYTDPTVTEFVDVSSMEMKIRNIKYIKTFIFQKHFPQIKYKKKFNGFEKLKQLDIHYRRELQQKYHYANNTILIEYDKLIEHKKNNIITSSSFIDLEDWDIDPRIKADISDTSRQYYVYSDK